MILSDVKIRVKRQFGDESGVQVTDSDIVRWVNDAQRGIVLENEGLLEKTAVIDSVLGQMEYTLPVDCLNLESVSYRSSVDVPYLRLQGYAQSQFDRYVDGWDSSNNAPGLPTVYTVFANLLKLFPSPSANSEDGIKFYYKRMPVDLSDDSDEIDLPIVYHNAVVNYCLGMAYEMDEDPAMVQLKNAQYQKDLRSARYSAGWPQKDTYQSITTLDDDAW